MSTPAVADWLPPALREAPDDPPGTPRLLDALLAAVDEQAALLAADIDQVWEDLFIESCADWAVPYIGSLLGLPADAERLEVAHAIALRRRKGTPAAMEDFAEVLSGWTARVIEGWQVSLWAQKLAHPPPLRPAAFDLRDGSRFRVGTPFERTRRSVTPSNRWSPRAATAVVWPWSVRTYRALEATALPEPRRFALHPLGAEAPLYVRPRPLRLAGSLDPSAQRTRTSDELDAPVRAGYRVIEALAAEGQITYGVNWAVSDEHPLAESSDPLQPALLSLSVGGAAVPWASLRFGALPPGVVPPAPPARGEVLVDVARGHVQLGNGLRGKPRASWHRPVPGALGALAAVAEPDPAARVVIEVNPALPAVGTVVHTLAEAFALGESNSAALEPADLAPESIDVEIRLATSDRLAAPPPQSFTPSVARWRLVAPLLSTPTIEGDLELNLRGGCLTLEGLALSGDLRLGPGLEGVWLRNLTMDPTGGATLAVHPEAWGLSLSAERSLLAPLRADLAATPIRLRDCVVDGFGASLRVCGGDAGGALRPAVAAVGAFGPMLSADGVTFAGPVRVEAADAVDCLFAGGMDVVQQQEGCLRHCDLGPRLTNPPSHPTTYRCGPFPAPVFASTGFEAAGYYTLALEPDHPLLSAASDGGELGAYRHARRAARLARLRRRLGEFVPLGLRPGLTLATWEE
jgi:hypothetical protein